MAGKTKENPRYNIASTRLTDGENKDLVECMGLTKKTRTEYIREAIIEKNELEKVCQ